MVPGCEAAVFEPGGSGGAVDKLDSPGRSVSGPAAGDPALFTRQIRLDSLPRGGSFFVHLTGPCGPSSGTRVPPASSGLAEEDCGMAAITRNPTEYTGNTITRRFSADGQNTQADKLSLCLQHLYYISSPYFIDIEQAVLSCLLLFMWLKSNTFFCLWPGVAVDICSRSNRIVCSAAGIKWFRTGIYVAPRL